MLFLRLRGSGRIAAIFTLPGAFVRFGSFSLDEGRRAGKRGNRESFGGTAEQEAILLTHRRHAIVATVRALQAKLCVLR